MARRAVGGRGEACADEPALRYFDDRCDGDPLGLGDAPAGVPHQAEDWATRPPIGLVAPRSG